MAKNKIEIPNLILDHLLQYGNTSILGLGTLFYKYHSAYLSEDRSQIFPPSKQLLFKDNTDGTDQFVQYVANRLGIDLDKASKKVDKYAQHIINNLLNYGKADILSVGQFSKADGKDIEFSQSHGEVNSEFFGLVPVKLKPIQFYKDGDMEDAPMAVSTEAVPNRTAASSTLVSPLTTGETQPTYNYNDEDNRSWLKPLLWIVVLLLACAFLFKACQSYKNKQADGVIENQIDSTDIVDGQKVVGNDAGSTSESEDSKSGVNSKSPTECVIILGAYESARNAMKMSNRISQLGYTPYEEYFDTMDVTRVGFKFDCGSKDLKDFIHEVREDIAKDAWYLVPRITVE